MSTVSASPPSIVGRAILALVLTVVFYAMAIAGSLALIGLPVSRWSDGRGFPIFIGIAMVIAGACVLFSIIPRRHRFEAPGLAVTRESQPELLALVEDVARRVGHPMPDDIRLTPEVNAAVTEVGAPLMRKRRILIIGLPLVELLTTDELRAVIAHEFGHYVGGDTRIGRWIYRTREAVLRTVRSLHWDEDGKGGWFERVVRAPFEAYAKLFMRITAAVSRSEEFAADRLAVEVAGRDAQVGALRRIAAAGPAFDAYWDSELVPALSGGVRPGVGEGFRRFLGHEEIDSAVGRVLEEELEHDRHDPYDSHPTLRQRVEAVGADPAEEPARPGDVAASLLRDHDALERDLLIALAGEDAAALRPVTWDEVPRMWQEEYERLVADHGAVLEGRRLAEAPDLMRRLDDLADDLERTLPDAEPVQRHNLAGDLVAAATTLALVRAGFTFGAGIGEPITCTRGEERFAPFVELGEVARDQAPADELRRRLEATGAGTEPLVAQAAAPAATG